jgi:hypothetical protein
MKTVSLKLAKQLKEQGYSQRKPNSYESLSYWWVYVGSPNDYELKREGDVINEPVHSVLAPTADEILDQLPHKLDFGDGIPKWLVMEKQATIYTVGYQADSKYGYVDGHIEENNLADAAAKMWLYLKQENLL